MFKKTKEKINNNQYVILFKKLWDNKRYRSILILCLYFIFFGVVISALRTDYQYMESDNSNNQSGINIEEKINNWYSFDDNYQYAILVNEEEVGNILVNDGIINLTVSNKQYIIINNIIYLNKDDNLKKISKIDGLDMSISILKLNIEDITKYLKNIKNYSYEDNIIKYQISSSYFTDIEESDELILVEAIGNDNLEKIIIHNDLENITLEIKER